MSSTEIATYRRLFNEKYGEVDELLTDLPAEALLWKPFETSPWKGPSNALGFILAHALSSTIYLLRVAEYTQGRIAWEQVDGDEGSDEFGPANYDPAYMRARAVRTHAFVNQFLDSLAAADLDGSRPHPRRPDRTLTVRYNIQHAIEHLSQHIGHAQLTRQLYTLQVASSPSQTA